MKSAPSARFFFLCDLENSNMLRVGGPGGMSGWKVIKLSPGEGGAGKLTLSSG